LNPNFKKYLLTISEASECNEIEVIQSLWSGYGKISRIELLEPLIKTVVVKHISLNQYSEHPRGWNTDISHARKVKSYEVETHWYKYWADRCTAASKIPQFLGSFSEGGDQWIVLEDLDTKFPSRKGQLDLSEVKVCLRWLAHFHSKFLHSQPKGLWKVGTYWHLETRPDEWNQIEHIKLKAAAHQIDEKLNNCKYQTSVHGDAKVANFCFSDDGKEVAAVDFQYVGGGCGIKDVAYFLGSCMSGGECEKYENELLDYYFKELKKSLESSDVDLIELEQEWRYLYPFACTDFMRFLLGWMPSHQKINDYNMKMIDEVLGSL